jgi:hypothetical protein
MCLNAGLGRAHISSRCVCYAVDALLKIILDAHISQHKRITNLLMV